MAATTTNKITELQAEIFRLLRQAEIIEAQKRKKLAELHELEQPKADKE